MFSSVQLLSRIWLCDPMDCSMPGFPVSQQLPEFTQTHVLWVSDAIQPSQPLSSPSPPTFNLSQHQGLFQWVSSTHEVAKVLEFPASTSVLPMNTQDWSPLGWTGWISLQSKGLSRVFSNTTVQKLACSLSQYTPMCIYDPTFIRCVCIPNLHHRPLRGIHTTVFAGKESGVTWMYKLGSG